MAKSRENPLRRLVGLDPLPQPPLIRTRHPVVLMHGFGMLAGLRRLGHLHNEAMDLRSHGVPAYAPNVAPYNTVAVRAESDRAPGYLRGRVFLRYERGMWTSQSEGLLGAIFSVRREPGTV